MSEVTKSKNSSGGVSPMMAAFTTNESALRRFLRRFTSNLHDIDDITQETIFRALKAEKTTEFQQPTAFLFGVARNLARKYLDKKSKSLIDFIEDYAPLGYSADQPSVDDEADGRERMILFGHAVASLPPQCQKVFVLKKVYGFTHHDISKKLGISVSTTEKHAAAGIRRCSEFMLRQTESRKTIIKKTKKRSLQNK